MNNSNNLLDGLLDLILFESSRKEMISLAMNLLDSKRDASIVLRFFGAKLVFGPRAESRSSPWPEDEIAELHSVSKEEVQKIISSFELLVQKQKNLVSESILVYLKLNRLNKII